MVHGADAMQTAPKAIEFYNAKVEELNTSLRELEKVVQAKSGNLRVVEDGTIVLFPQTRLSTSAIADPNLIIVLRQKLLAGEGAAAPAGGAAAAAA